jgi:hypothetical protein
MRGTTGTGWRNTDNSQNGAHQRAAPELPSDRQDFTGVRIMNALNRVLIVLVISGIPSIGGAQYVEPPAFTPFPETTIIGVVERIDDSGSDACEACQACSDCTGSHLWLRKGTSRIEVHLAPAWFLERSGFAFSAGDVVSVIGTRITIRKQRGIVAREVHRGNETMRFRDEHGLPLWRRELTEQ